MISIAEWAVSGIALEVISVFTLAFDYHRRIRTYVRLVCERDHRFVSAIGAPVPFAW